MKDERYKMLKEKGICVYCKCKPSEDGKVMCRACREKSRKQTAEKRAALIEMRICTECGSEKVFGKEKICPECAAKKYAYNTRHRKYDPEYHKNLKAKRRAEGLCTTCGKKKAIIGKAQCSSCTAKGRIRAARDRAGTIERSDRPSYGLCYTCGDRVEPGKRLCSKCSKKATNNLPKTNPNETWRMLDKALYRKRVGACNE